MPLSDKQCQAAKSRPKSYKLFDFEGLYLEVRPSEGKYWFLKYRLHGSEKRISLGSYPNTGLREARVKKDELRGLIANGIDPVQSRIEARAASRIVAGQTFGETAKEWFERQVPIWQPRYAATIWHRLEKYAFPFLEKLPIKTIKAPQVLVCLQHVEKTAPEMARRIKSYCHQVFLYAIASGRLDTDPTYGLEHALRKYRKGHFASIDVDRLPQFLTDLHNFKGRLHRQTYLAINLLMLTFLRTKELVEAEWTEIDFEKAIWTVPAERMKMKRTHLVPLSTQAIAILNELRENNGMGQYIFPSYIRPREPMSKGTILVALKRMGYSRKMTGHGFRALAMGVLKESLGYQHEIVDRQLAHVPKSSVDRAYDRAQFLSQRFEMMQRYANYLDEVYFKFMTKVLNGSLLLSKQE